MSLYIVHVCFGKIISYNSIISILQDGMTGLMAASLGGFVDTVRVLLEAKADPNLTDDVRLHYSHCLYNSNLMHYVTEW